MTDARQDIVNWARWGVANNAGFTYSENADRMEGVHKPGVTPCVCDCSAFVTYCYSWAGAPDPNGQNYDGQGYTGTLLSHGAPIALHDVVPGDVIVYGPGTGDHTAVIVEAGADPLTVSMGEQGDPSYVRVSQDGRQPQRYLRFDTTKIGTGATPGTGAPIPAAPEPSIQHILVPGVTVQQVQAIVGTAQDGVWGPQTEQAVKNFQAFFRVPGGADGVVGANTWAAMQYIAAQKHAAPAPNQAEPTIQQGATGAAVKLLQQKLNIPADGIFGPVTKAAVVSFQRSHRVGVDGIVGPQTWAALGA
jgi:peptidoglycan hydrolase-like protein with peptidoglycan-binding domain